MFRTEHGEHLPSLQIDVRVRFVCTVIYRIRDAVTQYTYVVAHGLKTPNRLSAVACFVLIFDNTSEIFFRFLLSAKIVYQSVRKIASYEIFGKFRKTTDLGLGGFGISVRTRHPPFFGSIHGRDDENFNDFFCRA